MVRFFVRRVLLVIPVLFGLLVLTFVLVRRSYLRELVTRGDPAASAAGVADA